jgi:ketosteroid isomerase-like protein
MSDKTAIREFVENFLDVRNRANASEILSFMDPAFRFRICGTDQLGLFTRPATKPEDVTAAVTALVADWDLSGLKNESIHVDGDTAFVHRKGTVRHIPSGKVIDTELMDKITVKDGRLVEYIQFIDTFLVAKTAGLA